MSVRTMRRRCLLVTVLSLLPTGCERRTRTQPHKPPSDAVKSQDANLSHSKSAKAETAPPKETTSITPSLAGEPDRPASGPESELSGGFRLEKETYCVGEPIFAVFEVTNNGKVPFSFFAKGSRANREVQFEVAIEDAAGNPVDPPPLHDSGGIGFQVVLKSRGGDYVRYFLLSRWARILSPGDYVARAARTLGPDVYSPAKGPTIRGTVRFKVEPYDCRRIRAVVLALKEPRFVTGALFAKPIRRALEDIAKTFNVSQFEQSIPDGELADKIVSELPRIWDDCYYLEPHLEGNRNWLTADAPEEFALTFSLRNNAPKSLPSGILGSRLSVDGTEIGAWKEMLAAVAGEKRLDRLKSGGVVEFSLRLNDYVKSGRPNQFTWRIHGRALRSDSIRFR